MNDQPALKLEPSSVKGTYQGLNKSAHDHLLKLTLNKFWGSLTLKLEDGKVVAMQEVRSIKP